MTEVLVAMLILGISVMAFAGMQTRSLQSTGIAYQRSQAMQLAAELVERMRANNQAMATYRTSALYAASSVPSGAPVTWPGSCIQTSVASDGCTPAQMATYDIHEIAYLAGQLLPAGQARVAACAGVAGVDCVFVAWGGTDVSTCVDNTTPNCTAMRVVIQ